METTTASWTLAELAEMLGGELVGPGDRRVSRLVPAGSDDAEGITFAGDEKYLKKALTGNAGVILVKANMDAGDSAHIRLEDPRAAYMSLLYRFEQHHDMDPGIHALASVHPTASIHPTARVGAYAVIGAQATVAAECRIHPMAYIGPRCALGEGTILYPRAVLVQDVEVGERCIIHSGAVLGADGFGFGWDGSTRRKIPQVGGVKLGDFVEVGANSCIDRATVGNTSVGSHTKIDNLVQVGHNVIIGEQCVLTGMVGVGGSTTIGNRVIVGANAGISDHVTICDDVTLGGRTGVASDIKEPGEYFGQPPQPMREAIRTFLLIPKLPEIWQRLRELEKRLPKQED